MRLPLYLLLVLSAATFASAPSAQTQEGRPDNASKDKGPAYSKLWREFEPKSMLAACNAHFDEIHEHGWRSGLSFDESPDTYKLFNVAGTISADRLKQLLATLKAALHKMAKVSGVKKVGEPSDKIEDRPIGVLRAMYSQRLIMPGSVRGFCLTYTDGYVEGAIDVIAVLNSRALDRWELACAVHEVVSKVPRAGFPVTPKFPRVGFPVTPDFPRAKFPMSDNSKEPAAPARVVMTGRVTLLVQSTNVKVALNPGEDVRKKLAEPLKRVTATRFDLADKTAIVIVFPSKAVSLNDAFNVIGKLVAVEGILTSANDPALVAVAGMKGVKQVPLLVAEKVTWLDDKNKVRFPAENRATIEGVADKAEIKFGATSAAWAIRNADARIPLTLTKDVAPPKAGSKVLASGLVRVVEGQPLLEADKVESLQR